MRNCKIFSLFLAKKIYFRDENGGSLLVWRELTCVAALRCRISYELGSAAAAGELELYMEVVVSLGLLYRMVVSQFQERKGKSFLRPKLWDSWVTSPHSNCQSKTPDQRGLKRYRKRLSLDERYSMVALQRGIYPEKGGVCDH